MFPNPLAVKSGWNPVYQRLCILEGYFQMDFLWYQKKHISLTLKTAFLTQHRLQQYYSPCPVRWPSIMLLLRLVIWLGATTQIRRWQALRLKRVGKRSESWWIGAPRTLAPALPRHNSCSRNIHNSIWDLEEIFSNVLIIIRSEIKWVSGRNMYQVAQSHVQHEDEKDEKRWQSYQTACWATTSNTYIIHHMHL